MLEATSCAGHGPWLCAKQKLDSGPRAILSTTTTTKSKINMLSRERGRKPLFFVIHEWYQQGGLGAGCCRDGASQASIESRLFALGAQHQAGSVLVGVTVAEG